VALFILCGVVSWFERDLEFGVRSDDPILSIHSDNHMTFYEVNVSVSNTTILIKENCQDRKEKLRHVIVMFDALGAANDYGPIMYDVLRSELMEST